MISLLVIILAFSIAGTANSKTFEAECEGKSFRVETINKGHLLDNEYRLSVRDMGVEKRLFIANEGGWFHAKCIKEKGKKGFLLFQSYCGGSGCAEDRYGIIDPISLQLLLEPGPENIGNSKEASKVLGMSPPYLPNEKGTFCCAEK